MTAPNCIVSPARNFCQETAAKSTCFARKQNCLRRLWQHILLSATELSPISFLILCLGSLLAASLFFASDLYAQAQDSETASEEAVSEDGVPSASAGPESTSDADEREEISRPLLLLAGGPVASLHNHLADVIARVVNHGQWPEGLRVVIEPTSGPMENLTRMAGGAFQLGIADAWLARSANLAAEPFDFLLSDDWLRQVATLEVQEFILLRREESIENQESAFPDRIGMIDQPSADRALMQFLVAQEQNRRALAQAEYAAQTGEQENGEAAEQPPSGLAQPEDIVLSEDGLPSLVEKFCAQEIDMIGFFAIHPNPVVHQLLNDCGALIVSVPEQFLLNALNENAWLKAADLPVSAYGDDSLPETIPATSSLPSLGLPILLLANRDLPADLLHEFFESLVTYRDNDSANSAFLAQGGFVWQWDVEVDYAAALDQLTGTLPFHPAMQDFLP